MQDIIPPMQKEQTDIHVSHSEREQPGQAYMRNYQNTFEIALGSKVREVLFLHA